MFTIPQKACQKLLRHYCYPKQTQIFFTGYFSEGWVYYLLNYRQALFRVVISDDLQMLPGIPWSLALWMLIAIRSSPELMSTLNRKFWSWNIMENYVIRPRPNKFIKSDIWMVVFKDQPKITQFWGFSDPSLPHLHKAFMLWTLLQSIKINKFNIAVLLGMSMILLFKMFERNH